MTVDVTYFWNHPAAICLGERGSPYEGRRVLITPDMVELYPELSGYHCIEVMHAFNEFGRPIDGFGYTRYTYAELTASQREELYR